MLRWARSFVVILAALAVAAGAGGGALAAKASHNCAGMAAGMSMDDCLGGDSGAATPACATLACASAQMAAPPLDVFFSRIIIMFLAPSVSPDDTERSGLRGPPDLRPPIG